MTPMKPLFTLLILLNIPLRVPAQKASPYLIAHRGGVVDSTYTENGMPALREAVRQGYRMVEIDLRVTKDGVLIANHDATFKRYYGYDEPVEMTTWQKASELTSERDGCRPLRIEEIFEFCKTNDLDVMLDNKIEGLQTPLFNELVRLLQRYHLQKTAIMIGTSASTAFFTGKIRLSCTRKQLEENQKKAGYRPENYFLFDRPANLTRQDIIWARQNKLLTVAAINKFHYRNIPDKEEQARSDFYRMLDIGVLYFQIDSEYRRFLAADIK